MLCRFSHILHLHLFYAGTVLKHPTVSSFVSTGIFSSLRAVDHNRRPLILTQPKEKKLFTICKVTGAICFNVLRFNPLCLHPPPFSRDAFQCFQDLKESIWCVIICSSLCNAHVNDSIFIWLVDWRKFKEENKQPWCLFHLPSIQWKQKRKRLTLPLISVSFLPTVIPSSDFCMFFSCRKQFQTPVSIILRISQFAESLLECLFVYDWKTAISLFLFYLWLFFFYYRMYS